MKSRTAGKAKIYRKNIDGNINQLLRLSNVMPDGTKNNKVECVTFPMRGSTIAPCIEKNEL